MSFAKIKGELRFRDLSSFNQALVAKQGWRLIQYPDSLVAKVLKARYFKLTNFFNAKLDSNLSFIWRSILWGRQILQKGTRWREGNGEKIQIHSNNWIPRPTTFRPMFVISLAADVKVPALIDTNHQWNVNLIDQNFAEEDAKKPPRR